jgi:NRPS condensation-like uncharacterized protein
MQYQRKLGTSERMADLINSITPHNVLASATLSHAFSLMDMYKLRRAIGMLKEKHPPLSYVIQKNIFFTVAQNSQPLVIETRHTRLEQLSEQALEIQLSDTEALFQVIIAPEGKKTNLLLLAQHTICDGKSILLVLFDLLIFYDQLLDNTSPRINPRPPRPCMEKLTPDIARKKLHIDEKLPGINHNSQGIESSSTGVTQHLFSQNESKKVFKLARLINVSVSSLFSASALMTLERKNTQHSASLGFNVMVNMRAFLDTPIENSELGFYSSYIHTDLKVTGYSLAELAIIIDRYTTDRLSNQWHFAPIDAYKNWLNSGINADELLQAIKIEKPTYGLSNLGIVEQTHTYKKLDIDSIYFCASSHSYSRTENNFFVCLATYNNKLSFTLHHSLPNFTRKRAREFSQDINSSLTNFSDDFSLIRKVKIPETMKQNKIKLRAESKLPLE